MILFRKPDEATDIDRVFTEQVAAQLADMKGLCADWDWTYVQIITLRRVSFRLFGGSSVLKLFATENVD